MARVGLLDEFGGTHIKERNGLTVWKEDVF